MDPVLRFVPDSESSTYQTAVFEALFIVTGFAHIWNASAGQQGQPSATQVYTIINNNDGVFGSYVCVDACAHGNTCIWQNAWLWQCNGTNPTHHYWVWEPDTNIIRSATTDTFEAYPEICLDMCTDSRYGNGACAITATTNTLNVGYAECTGLSNQVSLPSFSSSPRPCLHCLWQPSAIPCRK